MAVDVAKYGANLHPVARRVVALIDKYYPKSSEVYVTSSYRQFETDGGTWSHHNNQWYGGSQTNAVDFGAWDFGQAEGSRRMRDLAKWLYDNFWDLTVEMFHTTPYSDDNGFNVRNQDPASGIADHDNHIHYATSEALVASMEARAAARWPAGHSSGGTQPQTPPSGVNLFVLDYAFARPTVASLKAGGVKAVSRYLSQVNNATRPKILTEAEALELSQAGVGIIANFEWYEDRAGEGFTAGAVDARVALAQAQAAGMPEGRPIYFSADMDYEPHAVTSYYQGINSVLPLSQIGVYGSYRVVKHLLDNGLVTWAWQTYAWSGGQWDPRNHFEQYQNNVEFGGGTVDYNRSKKPDFGQWYHRSIQGDDEMLDPAEKAGLDNVNGATYSLANMLPNYAGFSNNNPAAPTTIENKMVKAINEIRADVKALKETAAPALDYDKLAQALLRAIAGQ